MFNGLSLIFTFSTKPYHIPYQTVYQTIYRTIAKSMKDPLRSGSHYDTSFPPPSLKQVASWLLLLWPKRAALSWTCPDNLSLYTASCFQFLTNQTKSTKNLAGWIKGIIKSWWFLHLKTSWFQLVGKTRLLKCTITLAGETESTREKQFQCRRHLFQTNVTSKQHYCALINLESCCYNTKERGGETDCCCAADGTTIGGAVWFATKKSSFGRQMAPPTPCCRVQPPDGAVSAF